ncbi:acetyl-CoA carboxylase biotin carboxyl carrier protein subunit [Thalassospiraceae bacterium LMO-JJ14]|nr:acetyl-CoA carboxylase biotin carboxyl carrier protein subunit [Thalassospiraceae bacterium LMO-JJ14]
MKMAQIEVLASVTGSVWKIEKKVGESVSAGEEIMILESMKMEIGIEAPADGTVSAINVAEQDAVDEDQVLALIETAD